MQVSCHKLIRKVAQEAAGQLYETVMGDNKVFAEWKRQNPEASIKELEKLFIKKNWPKCIPYARSTLALMLRGPLPDHLKEDIVDALAKDQTLRLGRPDNYRRLMH